LKFVRNLIFDLDGTLIDSSDGVVDAVNYSLRMMNQPEQPPERIKPYIGFPLSTMYPEFTDVPVAELCRHFQVRAAQTVVDSTVVLEGVEASLAELRRAGFRMAIATTKVRVHVKGILAKFGWQSFFEAVVGGDEVRRVKPAPEAFELVLKRLGVQSHDSVVVGDTINDIVAAHAVPMKVVAVNSPYGGREKLLAGKPDYFVETVEELPDLLISTGSGRDILR